MRLLESWRDCRLALALALLALLALPAVQRARRRGPDRHRELPARRSCPAPPATRRAATANTAAVLQKVNEWRAVPNLAPIPASQLQSSGYNRFDIRVSRAVAIGGTRSIDLVAQVFNLFGRDNLVGGTGGTFINNSLSASFGKYSVAAPRREAEVGISFKF
jgi:hypothetical protein